MKITRSELVTYHLGLSSNEFESLYHLVDPNRQFVLTEEDQKFQTVLYERMRLEIRGG